MNTEAASTTGKPSSKGAFAAALSAIGSVLAALTCCLPVLPFVLAAGTASSARFLSSSGFIKAGALANAIANRVFSAK